LDVFDFTLPCQEPGFGAWKEQLGALPLSHVTIRAAEPTVQDGRWIRWVQADCESTNIQTVEYNMSKIEQRVVLLAEIAEHPVGFCCALVGRTDSDPLFIQLVAVVPLARRRGAGLALLSAASEREPQRSIAMATLDDNNAARRLNEHFAKSMGANIRRVPVRQYRRTDLGFAQGERHRPWIIECPQEAD
jgi:GNAT superfamily N-acetyltransferase